MAFKKGGKSSTSRVHTNLSTTSGRSTPVNTDDIVDPEGWHTCSLPCRRPLACGQHLCNEPDHKGPCPPCLAVDTSERVCPCGRSILNPPIYCGTRMDCPYPCQVQPECGHPAVSHNCHPLDEQCPFCPYLTTKRCICGQTEIRNVRCASSNVRCHNKCNEVLDCGWHTCQKICQCVRSCMLVFYSHVQRQRRACESMSTNMQ